MSLTRTKTDPKQYFLDGEDLERCPLAVLPGTTDILADAGYINKERYENFGSDGYFRDRGQFIHEACDLMDLGKQLRPESVSGYSGYLNSYRLAQPKLPKIVTIEESFYDPVLCYAGTRDRRYGGAVGDLKSAKQSAPWWRLQLAAYALPLGPPYPEIFDIQLFESGAEAKIFKIEGDKYLAAAFLFLSALVSYHAKRKLPLRHQEALALAAVQHLSALRHQLHGRREEVQVHRVLSEREVAEGSASGDAGRPDADHEEVAA